MAQTELSDGLPLSTDELTQVNINTAGVAELSNILSGIGSSKAAAIVACREQNGRFESVDDLIRVQGVGAVTLNENRHLVTVGVE